MQNAKIIVGTRLIQDHLCVCVCKGLVNTENNRY